MGTTSGLSTYNDNEDMEFLNRMFEVARDTKPEPELDSFRHEYQHRSRLLR